MLIVWWGEAELPLDAISLAALGTWRLDDGVLFLFGVALLGLVGTWQSRFLEFAYLLVSQAFVGVAAALETVR